MRHTSDELRDSFHGCVVTEVYKPLDFLDKMAQDGDEGADMLLLLGCVISLEAAHFATTRVTPVHQETREPWPSDAPRLQTDQHNCC